MHNSPFSSHEPSFDPDDAYASGGSHEPFEQAFTASPSSVSTGTPPCPKCQSERVEVRNRARKVTSAIGTVAGTTSSVALTWSGAEIGATVGIIAGPVGSVCGGIAGAIIAGLIGGATGCVVGSALGGVIDSHVLNNYRCHACNHTFSSKPS